MDRDRGARVGVAVVHHEAAAAVVARVDLLGEQAEIAGIDRDHRDVGVEVEHLQRPAAPLGDRERRVERVAADRHVARAGLGDGLPLRGRTGATGAAAARDDGGRDDGRGDQREGHGEDGRAAHTCSVAQCLSSGRRSSSRSYAHHR
jgi:hypothetical protein